MATAMPRDGRVVSMDVNEDFANFGKPFWEKVSLFFEWIYIVFKVNINKLPFIAKLKILANQNWKHEVNIKMVLAK